MPDAEYWVWLQEGLGTANVVGNLILEKGLSAKEIYQMSHEDLQQLELFSPSQIMKLKMASLSNAQKICEDCAKKHYSIVTPDMETYPDRLRNISAPPLVLYVEGKQECLEHLDDIPVIGIVGTRKASAYGCRVAANISFDLANAGFITVSGLALGIDAQAHQGALRGGGITIAVLGCGLDVNYPPQNSILRKSIGKVGAVLTEYPPSVPPIPRNFPVRNRIISGISLGILVVEADPRSGSLITAGHALSQGRDVFAVPTDIYDPNGGGVLKLIQDGAKTITCAKDIADEYINYFNQRIAEQKMTNTTVTNRIVKVRKLEPERKTQVLSKGIVLNGEALPKKATEEQLARLTDSQKMIYELLTLEPQTIEQLLQKSKMQLYKLLAIMTEMELLGLVQAYPGKRFSL